MKRNSGLSVPTLRLQSLSPLSLLSVEEGLEDEGGGDLVYDSAVLLAAMAGFIEDLVGCPGGESLVVEVDGEGGEGAKFGSEGLGFGGLGTGRAGEVDGVADDDGGDGEAAGEPGEGAEVVAGIAMTLKSEDRLGGEAEFVRDGDADAAVTDIEGEVSGWRCGDQLSAPSFQLKGSAGGIGLISPQGQYNQRSESA